MAIALVAGGAACHRARIVHGAEAVPESLKTPLKVVEAANRLDKHYIPARYPSGFAEGYPGRLYTRGEAEGAIQDAKTIIEFSRGYLPR